jgi:5-methylcytosine-specific restriction endonuclease McrA
MNPNAKRRNTTNVENNDRECIICRKRKPLEEFGRDKKRLLGRMYECKECHNRRGRLNKNKPGQRFAVYKSGARVRKIKFELSYKQFMTLWGKPCYYCGVEIDGIGLDRKDPSVGYNINNIVPCCTQCNRAKTIQTTDDFISMCIKVAKRFDNHIVDPNVTA